MSSWRRTDDDRRGAILTMWRPLERETSYECAVCRMDIGEREMRHILELSSVDGSGRRDPPWQCDTKLYFHDYCVSWVGEALRLMLGWRRGGRRVREGDWDD